MSRRPAAAPAPRLAVRALGSRNFRLFFAGQSISLVGTWLQQVALSWLVYRLTGSAFMLGLVGFFGQIPAFIVSPVAGVLADHWDRHRTIVATQALSMVQALLLAGLVLAGRITVPEILVLSMLLGVVNGFDTPTRQAFLVQMVEKKQDLANAIALNSSMFNGARLVGPALAGMLIALVGEGACFLLNGLSYLAVIAALLAMRLPPPARPERRPRVVARLREGFTYAFGFGPIRAVLTLLALVSIVGVPYTVLMPVIATRVLHGGPSTLGALMGATGLGALIGALYLAARSSVVGLGRVIVMAAAVFGAGLVAFSFSTRLWLSLPLLLVTGFGMMVQMAASNTILQTIVDEDKRGRVMSLYTMAFTGTVPLGSLLAGAAAARIGAPWTIAAGGVASILGAFWFAHRLPALRVEIRPVFVRLGIVPEVAAGLHAATALMVPPEKQ